MDVEHYMLEVGQRAKTASSLIAKVGTKKKNHALLAIASSLNEAKETILAANAIDIEVGQKRGLSPALLDRLAISEENFTTQLDIRFPIRYSKLGQNLIGNSNTNQQSFHRITGSKTMRFRI